MDNILDIAELNPVKFYDLSYTPDVNRLTRFMDYFLYGDQIRNFQEPALYCQKWMQADTINLQFSANYGPLEITILDCYEQVYATIIPGVASSQIYNQPFYFYEAQIALSSLPEGRYYLKLKIGSGSGIKYYASEPFEVSILIENSLHLSYWNSENDYDVAFDTGIQFDLRVEGGLSVMTPDNKSKVYEDQNLNNVRLSSFPFRSYKLIIGGPEGVPDYVADKVNRIFGCSTVLIDGKEFVRTEGAKMERNGEENYPMAGWSFEVREGQNRKSTRFINPASQDRRVNVIYNIRSKLFGDLSTTGASNADITISEIE